MIFDTHAHYDDKKFDADRREVLAAMPAKGVSLIVDPGCDGESSRAACALAQEFPFVYAAVGWHPEEWQSWNGESMALLRSLCAQPKVVAIGEIGLDYYWKPYNREKQLELFRRQLDMAIERDMPVSMHIREAYGDCMEVLESYGGRIKGVMHCFSGSAEIAERCAGLGLYIAFGGALTFRSNKKGPAACAATPIDRLLTETDCPYMAPEPHRGERNDPGYIPLICGKMAEIKGVSADEMARRVEENAERLFGI